MPMAQRTRASRPKMASSCMLKLCWVRVSPTKSSRVITLSTGMSLLTWWMAPVDGGGEGLRRSGGADGEEERRRRARGPWWSR